jgi:hypothetical protein
VVTTDQCQKSGMGTPMFSRKGAATIPTNLAFRENWVSPKPPSPAKQSLQADELTNADDSMKCYDLDAYEMLL